LGVLELPVSGQADTTEDYYFSGVYIESGSLTTSVAGPGGVVVSTSPSSTTGSGSGAGQSTTLATSTTVSAVTSTAAGNLPKYSQCAGIQWTGSGTCVSGTTCVETNEYYSQCL